MAWRSVDLHEGGVLKARYFNLSPGGYLIIDDYWGVEAYGKAVHDYRDEHGLHEPIKRIDWTGAYWRREAPGA